MERLQASIRQQFLGCSISPITKKDLASSPVHCSDKGVYSTTSYYLDSSGRTKFRLQLKLDCRCKEDLDNLLAERIISPTPTNYNVTSELDENEDDISIISPPISTLRLEVKSLASDGTKIVTIEGISVISTSVQGTSLHLQTEIIVRAATPIPMNGPAPSKWSKDNSLVKIQTQPQDENDALVTQLEICAVLVSKPLPAMQSASHPAGLLALELGSLSFHPSHQLRLAPIALILHMTSALSLSVRNVTGSSGGSTLVSLTIRHSDTHSEPVLITNVAFHPGHSRPDIPYNKTDHSMPGGQTSVTDMSKFVKWGYVPRTEPALPLTLHPHDAYSTVLTIEAGEDLRSRSFVSPVSVTAMVGVDRVVVVVATDAHWNTGQMAVEPADAFRIDMNVAQQFNYVGVPLVVSLRVLNLSTKTRDLMLLMAKDDDKNVSASTTSSRQQSGTVNAAVVSQVNGYTFGVWGLSEDDDGTTRQNRDHDLLAVDAALLLGEVKGQHSVDAELRFVPLREGTLDVPNLKLYDKTESKWYNCIHKLRIVAAGNKAVVS